MFKKIRIVRSFLRYGHPEARSRKELESFQQRAIKKHLAFLRKKSPYYRQLAQEKGRTLEEIPVADKSSMMEHFDRMVTLDISRDQALNTALESEKSRDFSSTLKGVTVGLSSGTSGHRGLFITSSKEMDLWTGAILSRALPRERRSFKIAFFLRANSNLYENVGSRRIRFQYFDIYQPMEGHIEKLNAYQPDILVAPPSVLHLLAQAVEEQRLSIHPLRVISVAEVLEKKDAESFGRIFKQPVIHQIYQSTEGFLGYSCSHGTLHLNEDIVYFEKEFLDDSRFIPVITDFTRRSQPIVRYRLNDILVLKKSPCGCGSPFTALEAIEGREDDIFEFRGSQKDKVVVFPDQIRRAILYVEGISHYQVVQQQDSSLTVYLDNPAEAIQKRLNEEFRDLAEQMKFKLPPVEFFTYQHQTDCKLKRIKRL